MLRSQRGACWEKSCPLCLVLQRWGRQRAFFGTRRPLATLAGAIATCLGKQALMWRRTVTTDRYLLTASMPESQCETFGFKWGEKMNTLRRTHTYSTPSRFQSLCQVAPEWKQLGGQLSCHAAVYGKRLWESHPPGPAPWHWSVVAFATMGLAFTIGIKEWDWVSACPKELMRRKDNCEKISIKQWKSFYILFMTYTRAFKWRTVFVVGNQGHRYCVEGKVG